MAKEPELKVPMDLTFHRLARSARLCGNKCGDILRFLWAECHVGHFRMGFEQERRKLLDIKIRPSGYRLKRWSNVSPLYLIIRDQVATRAPALRQSRAVVRVGSQRDLVRAT